MRDVRIVVDARLLHGGGIGRYIREVTSRWLDAPEVGGVRFLGDPEALEPWLAGVDDRGIAECAAYGPASYSLRTQWQWLRNAPDFMAGMDAAFFPHYDAPLFRHPTPSVVVVHDLTQYLVPECFPRRKRMAGGALLRGAATSCDRIVTVSDRSRRDLVARFPALAGRVEVVHNGVSPVFRRLDPEERAAAEERWGHLRPYLLVVGPDRCHKNLSLVVHVLEELIEEEPELRVLWVGGDPDRRGPMMKAAAEKSLDDRVIPAGPLDDASLRAVYGLAEVLLYPSLYEGFGLPPLEALACGCRVLATRAGAVPEVTGSAARTLDPETPPAWIAAVRDVLNGTADDGAPDEGIAHANGFTWDECARKTLSILQRMAG